MSSKKEKSSRKKSGSCENPEPYTQTEDNQMEESTDETQTNNNVRHQFKHNRHDDNGFVGAPAQNFLAQPSDHQQESCSECSLKDENKIIPVFRIDHMAKEGLLGIAAAKDPNEKPHKEKNKAKKKKAKAHRDVIKVNAIHSCYTEQDEFGNNIYVRLEDHLNNTFIQFGEAEFGNEEPMNNEVGFLGDSLDAQQDPETGERKMLVKFTCLQKGSDSGNGPRINSGYAVASTVEQLTPHRVNLLREARETQYEIKKGPSNMITWFMRLDWHNPRPGTPKPRVTVDIRDGDETQTSIKEEKDKYPTVRLQNLSKGAHQDSDFKFDFVDKKFFRRDSYEENECELFGEEVAQACNKISNLYQKRLFIWSIRELMHNARTQAAGLRYSSDEEPDSRPFIPPVLPALSYQQQSFL